MKKRNRAQAMGIWLNEPLILHPDRLKDAVTTLAKAGYGIIRLVQRNTNLAHRSPETLAALRLAVETAHANGVRVVVDSEPHRDVVGRDMGSQFPEAMATRLIPVRTRVVNGTFQLRMTAPRGEAGHSIFEAVEAAFLRREGRVEKLESLTYDLTWEKNVTRDRWLEQDYVYGRAFEGETRVGRLIGALDAPSGSELIAYVRVSDLGLIDFWSDGCQRYYEALLECYRGIPLDGVMWDEPAVGGEWTNYRYGSAFAQAFEKRCGYRLADRLWLLDEPGLSPESMRVRLDYYHTLNEGLFQAQKAFLAKAVTLFEPEILRGTHHTWQGEGGINDYRAGAVDYFRLNENMDAGYTDCCWWDMGSVAYAYALGSSLGRLTPSGEAEVNTWHSKPTNLQVQYNARLMTLVDITWFNIWYGADADVSGYPTHYTWREAQECMRQHRDDQARLAGARPVMEVAIWHGWEGVCAMNLDDMAGAQKTFCINTALLCLERNAPFDFVDSGLLEGASIEGQELVTALERYRILIMPYAVVLPRKAWDVCVAFARAGGKVIFVGPPPEFDTEGQSLGKDFAALLQMAPVSFADFRANIESFSSHWDGRPEKLDITYPLRGDAARLLTSVEDEPHGMRSSDGSVFYLTDLDPRERLLNLVRELMQPEVRCHSDSIQWRLYRRGGRAIIVCIARKERRMRGIVIFRGHEIEITDGTVGFIEEEGGKIEIYGHDFVAAVR